MGSEVEVAVTPTLGGVAREFSVAAGVRAGAECGVAVLRVAAEAVVDGGVAEVFAEELDAGAFHEPVDPGGGAAVLARERCDSQGWGGLSAGREAAALGTVFSESAQVGEALRSGVGEPNRLLVVDLERPAIARLPSLSGGHHKKVTQLWTQACAAPIGGAVNQARRPTRTRSARPEAVRVERTGALREHPQAHLVPAADFEQYRMLRGDIEERGIVTPLEVTAGLVVLDGHQRLRIASELELATVPVRIVNVEDEVRYLLLAALRRRHLSASQRAALALELEECEQARLRGRARQRANLRQNAEVATLPPRGKRTRELAARLAGASPRTVQDAATVRAHDPELFEQIKQGEVAAADASRRLRRRLRDAETPPPAPLPEGPFDLIYADPPWRLGNPDSAKAPENYYPTMPLEEIVALRPPAADDALLYLWAVNMLLPEALRVIEAWGFEYVANLVWVKPSIGLGAWTRNRHELLLVGRRGRYPPPDPEDRPDSVIEAARGRHSQKPDRVYELLERAHPHARKLELFARTQRPGWAAWGNEAQ